MKISITLFIFTLLIPSSCHQNSSVDNTYIDTIIPDLKPVIFAKGFISKDSISEFGSIFNKANDEFYFAIDSANKAYIKCSKYIDGKWTIPKTIVSDSTYSFNDPFLSNDENRLYYISNKPKDAQDTIKDYDIWYSQRIENGWSKPINAGTKINTDAHEYYISFTDNGAMYFASNKGKSDKRRRDFDIYTSEFRNGKFENPRKLNDAINSKRYEADVFIAPDESYIIFCAARKSGFGEGDLYISFKDKNGDWTPSKNMGATINTEAHELCPFVTKDGKYLFYTSKQDIYWVSAEIIDELKAESKKIN